MIPPHHRLPILVHAKHHQSLRPVWRQELIASLWVLSGREELPLVEFCSPGTQIFVAVVSHIPPRWRMLETKVAVLLDAKPLGYGNFGGVFDILYNNQVVDESDSSVRVLLDDSISVSWPGNRTSVAPESGRSVALGWRGEYCGCCREVIRGTHFLVRNVKDRDPETTIISSTKVERLCLGI